VRSRSIAYLPPFATQPLNELLESDEKFGFIIMDGSGSLFGTLAGNTRTVMHRMTVELPKKHGRGGQSALRFARLRLEKRHNYVRKVAELATQFFIQNDKPTVSGLILAGLADFKNELAQTDMFDQRLQRIIVKIVDVSYGGDNGFNQAIELSQDTLRDVKFIQEKKLVTKFFDEIAIDSGKYCFGIRDTMSALEGGAVEDLIMFEDLELERVQMLDPETKKDKIVFLTAEQAKEKKHFVNEAGAEMEIVDRSPITEWFAEHYKEFGCRLNFVTNKSQEGSQFVRGFGGVGALLRYKMDFTTLDDDFGIGGGGSDGENADEDDFDFDF
jgi:peptide chain release factor subunit 1